MAKLTADEFATLKKLTEERRALQRKVDQIERNERPLKRKIIDGIREAGKTTMKRGPIRCTITERKLQPKWKALVEEVMTPERIEKEREAAGSYWLCEVTEE